jgi:LemA protein
LADLVDSAVGEVVAVAAAPDGNKKNCRIAELQDCRKEGRKEFLQILPAILQFCNSAMERTPMMTLHRTGALVIVLLVTPTIGGCSYNRFVTQEEAIKAQWAQVQNQLQRRNDLIPNLVETVKGYAAHEEGVFKAVADSRTRLASAATPADAIEAANAQSSALARLLAIVENYPQLKANESFNRLMDELSGTENRIAVERMRYNERVQEYNTSKRRFPSNVTAAIFSFKDYPFFEAPADAQKVPTVNFRRPQTD